jgi:hypothetical protein
MKTQLGDLNTHLFEQLERLNDSELQGEALKEEITRSKAVQGIGIAIVNNAKLVLDAAKFKAENRAGDLPAMLSDERPLDKPLIANTK